MRPIPNNCIQAWKRVSSVCSGCGPLMQKSSAGIDREVAFSAVCQNRPEMLTKGEVGVTFACACVKKDIYLIRFSVEQDCMLYTHLQ